MEKFKGMRREFNLEGNTIFQAENGLGKTTIADGIAWLFTGKDSLGRVVDYKIKPTDNNGVQEEGIDVSFAIVINTGNEDVEIKKTLKEQYTGKGVNKHIKGHTTKFFINDVAVSSLKNSKKVFR